MTLHRKTHTIIILVVVALVCGLVVFVFFGQVSLWVGEDENLRVAIVVATLYEPNEDGQIPIWPNWRELHDGDKLEYDEFIELWLIVDSYFSQNAHMVERALYRNGEIVNVVYISITQSHATFIYQDIWGSRIRTQGRFVPSLIFENADNGSYIIEVYYLRSLHRIQRRINRLSDEDFDALRADAIPVWRGVVVTLE